MRKYIFGVMITAAVFAAVSCTTKGDPGIAGADGSNTASALFQNGAAPSSGYAGCEDTQILATSTNTNFGACNYMLGGGYMGDPYHILIKFDVSYITPHDVNVKSAKLTLYFDNADDMLSPNTYTAYAVNKDWSEGTAACGGTVDVDASWLYYDGTANSWDTAGGDYGASAVSDSVYLSSVSDGASITFALNADTVESWIKNPDTNYGILIKGDTAAGMPWMRPCSSETTAGNYYRPRLEVNYTLP